MSPLHFLIHIKYFQKTHQAIIHDRTSHPEVFLRKGVLKICSKFTGEHPCRSVILEHLWMAASDTIHKHILFNSK